MLLDIFKNFENYSFADAIAGILAALMVIFLTMPIHEYAHALIATKLGDPTPKFAGRLSLNPFNHIDYMGALSIIIVGIGWAKPVGINPRYFKNPKMGMALTAVAGPLSNIIMAFVVNFVSVFLLWVFYITNTMNVATLLIISFLDNVAYLNVALGVFNLIPLPPFDGSRILGIVLPDRIYFKIMSYERYIYIAVLALLIFDVFDKPLAIATQAVMQFINILPSIIFF